MPIWWEGKPPSRFECKPFGRKLGAKPLFISTTSLSLANDIADFKEDLSQNLKGGSPIRQPGKVAIQASWWRMLSEAVSGGNEAAQRAPLYPTGTYFSASSAASLPLKRPSGGSFGSRGVTSTTPHVRNPLR